VALFIRYDMEKIKCKATPQELYNIVNNQCPICDKEFNYITNIVSYRNKGYHEECFFLIYNYKGSGQFE
jgi:hypothetical protein